MNTETLGIYIIPDSEAELPQFSTEGSACFDICARLHKPTIAYGPQNVQVEIDGTDGFIDIPSGWRVLVPTGIILDIPQGFSVRLHSRSGLALKEGLILANAEGVIDSDYTQELMVMVTPINGSIVTVNNGMRICQGELVRNQPVAFTRNEFPPQQKTDRIGGFGSTGV
jgi:dUTP pyrophosphatase